ncbi:MAG: hypothetical protein HKM93_11050 [Desulfobacteraceae bacterium]|nr:hypothetical protein [Desulfobacteraceae bacterium]
MAAAPKKIIFLGCPLDCDEKYDSIMEKLAGSPEAGTSTDPLVPVLHHIGTSVAEDRWDVAGSVPVPDWLLPLPPVQEHGRINAEEMVSFIDGDNCRKFAATAGQWTEEKILPQIPCLVAVDHSISGGVFSALSRHYGRDNLSLIIVDSHTDAVPMDVLAGAVQYDMDTNPNSVHDANDPLLYNRPDSYNASTFVHHLLEKEVVDARNLYLIGVSDYPDKKARRIKDPRIGAYVEVFSRLKEGGVSIVTKKECKLKPQKVDVALKRIDTPYVYVSIDMDIGARNALNGVRFRNWQGLMEKQINRIGEQIAAITTRGIELAGIDVTEFNMRYAGRPGRDGRDGRDGIDPTFQIAADLLKTIAF